jgi:hypothetical protein
MASFSGRNSGHRTLQSKKKPPGCEIEGRPADMVSVEPNIVFGYVPVTSLILSLRTLAGRSCVKNPFSLNGCPILGKPGRGGR